MKTQTAATLRRRFNRQQLGFTLLEVLISMFVLTVGLVSMLGVFATAMAATQTAQQDMIAKQLAQQAMETIYTARETANITWDQIQNVGGAGSRAFSGPDSSPSSRWARTALWTPSTTAPLRLRP